MPDAPSTASVISVRDSESQYPASGSPVYDSLKTDIPYWNTLTTWAIGSPCLTEPTSAMCFNIEWCAAPKLTSRTLEGTAICPFKHALSFLWTWGHHIKTHLYQSYTWSLGLTSHLCVFIYGPCLFKDVTPNADVYGKEWPYTGT